MENRMNVKLSLLIILGLVFFTSAYAQQIPPHTLWNDSYGRARSEWCKYVQQTTDGGYILAGYAEVGIWEAHDYWLVKTDENGDSLWCSWFGRDLEIDECYSAQQTSDGGYILAGDTRSFGADETDVWMIKTDENGDSLWSRIFGGTERDYCYSVQQTSDGGYILAGKTSSFGASNCDFWLIKTDENGDSLWSRTYGGVNADACESVQQTSDGGYILAGQTQSFGAGNYDFWLVKTDVDGVSLWSRTFGGTAIEYCNSVQQTSDGGYILAGKTNSFGAGNDDFWVVKTDENGDSLWSRTFGGNSYETCFSVIESSDHRYVLAGYTSSFGAGNSDFWLVKVDSDGDSLWSQTYGSQYYGTCYSVQQTADGGFIMGGTISSNDWNFCLVKTGPDFIGITLDLIPHNTPIQIPSGGGSLQFDAEIMNSTQITGFTIDVWTTITLPNGVPYTVMTREDINMPVGNSILRPDLTQNIPGTAMPGIYTYTGYTYDSYTLQAYDEDFFTFEKLHGDEASAHDYEWSLFGWDEDDEGEVRLAPTEFVLMGAAPNPFNPTTVIRYELRVASSVSLTVFDIQRKQVAELVNSWRDAGMHEVTWDASGVASGIYIYRLTAGELSKTDKIILMK